MLQTAPRVILCKFAFWDESHDNYGNGMRSLKRTAFFSLEKVLMVSSMLVLSFYLLSFSVHRIKLWRQETSIISIFSAVLS